MCLPCWTEFKCWSAYAPSSVVCSWPRSTAASALRQHCVWSPRCLLEPPSAQSPFAQCWFFFPHIGEVRTPPPARTLRLGHRSYGLIRQSRLALLAFGLSLVQEVFASCYQPLLPTGSSRHYFCKSFLGCLVPCHGGPTKCTYLFLPPCHRPSPTEVWVGFPA